MSGYQIDRYQLNNIQPGWPADIPEGSINATSTSLKLPGRGIPNYGEMIAENFVHILENFAGPNPPLNPIVGQLWYNINFPGGGSLMVYNGIDFVRISGVEIDTTPFFINPSSGRRGDLKYYEESGRRRLYVHNGNDWQLVSGVIVSNNDPPQTIGNDGDKWFNFSNDKLFLKANGTWLNLLHVNSDLNYGVSVGAILANVGSHQFVVIFAEGNIIAIFSYSNIPFSLLPTEFKLPGNPSIEVNLQLYFPNGLRRGLNFSNIAGNSIVVNPSPSDEFMISSNSGRLTISGPSNNRIQFDNQGRILVNTNTQFNTTSHIKLPAGTTSQRNTPFFPQKGSIRFNTDDNDLEFFDGVQWVKLLSGSGGSQVIPPGSVMIFYQNSAPIGWTTVTGLNDSLVRIVDSGGGTSGGVNNFSSVNNSFTFPIVGSTLGHVLTISQLPRHGHPFVLSVASEEKSESDKKGGLMMRNKNVTQYINNTGGASGTLGQQIGSTGGNQPHSHDINLPVTINLNIKYINAILCSKN